MIVVDPVKPEVDMSPGRVLSYNPSKNYLLHLMAKDVQAVGPRRSFDLGIGELRNLWMFPGQVSGITFQRSDYLKGLKRKPNPEIFRSHGLPQICLMRFESDFSFFGSFDLCLCTNALANRKYPTVDIVERLIDRVKIGGSLMLSCSRFLADYMVELLDPQFDVVRQSYIGLKTLDQQVTDRSQIGGLTLQEMTAPNVPGEHRGVYFRADGKLTEAGPARQPPLMRVEASGLRIVEDDMPLLVL